MVIITLTTVTKFINAYPHAGEALKRWRDIVSKADWKSIKDIRNDFNNVDYVGNDRYVFNIKGNDYRLVAMIHFDIRTLYVRFIGTHTEYDKTDCTTI